jgi:hypothetical protein
LIKTEFAFNPLVTAETSLPLQMLITLHLPYYGKLLVYKTVQEFAHHGDFRCNGRVEQSP